MINNYLTAKGKDLTFIPASNGTSIGFVDQENNVLIPARYDAVSFFDSLGFATVMKGGMYGIINTKNVEVVPPISKQIMGYSKVSNIDDDIYNSKVISGLYAVQSEDISKWLIFAPPHPQKASAVFPIGKPAYDDRLSYPRKAGNPNMFTYGYHKIEKENGLVNFIDTLLNEVLADDVINGAALSSTVFVVWDEHGKAGLIKRDGSFTIAPAYYSIATSGLKDVYMVTSLHGNVEGNKGLVNAEGRILLDTIYQEIKYLQHDQFSVSKNAAKGIVNIKQRVIVPPQAYEEYKKLTPELYAGRKQYQNFILDTAGTVLGGPYKTLVGAPEFDLVYSHRGDSTFYYDASGKFLFVKPGIQKVIDGIPFGFVFMEKDKEGFMDRKAVVHLFPVYTSVKWLGIEDAVLVFSKDSREFGIYSLQQKWVIPMQDGLIRKDDNPAGNSKDNVIAWTKGLQTITYTNTLKNPEIKPFLYNGASPLYTIKEYVDKKEITLLNGQKYSYPNERSLEPVSNGQVLFFEMRIKGGKQILDTDMKPILPDGYLCDAVYPYKDSYVFRVRSEDHKSGLFVLEGKWLLEPAVGRTAYSVSEVLWVLGKPGEVQLFSEDLQLINQTIYKEIKTEKESFIVGNYRTSNQVDVYDLEGKMISEGQYSGFITRTKIEVAARKSQQGDLISCVLDTMWNEKQCYPFAEVYPIESNPDYLIVKDLYDFGVINRQGDVVIPFRYEEIVYLEAINMFKIRKGTWKYDFVTPSGKAIIKDAKGVLNSNPLGGPYIVFKGDDYHYVINKDTGKSIAFPVSLGTLTVNSQLAEVPIISLEEGKKITFVNAETGMVYKIK